MGHKEWVAYRSMLGHLRRRFRGIDDKIGSTVADMADHIQGPEPVRAWVDIQPRGEFPGEWQAWVNGRTASGETFRFPVIPDEFNPRPDKLVRVDDQPHIFKYMSEAEEAAAHALAVLKEQLTQKLKE